MVLFWITLVLALSDSNAEGEFCILHSPDSLMFEPRGETLESTLKDIFAAALGLSVPYDSEWDGLHIMDPFNTPEAAVQVHINGVSGLGANYGLNSKIFPLLVDEYEPDTFKGVKLRIKQRFDVGGNELLNFKLSDVTKFNRIRTVFGKVDTASYKKNHAPLLIYLKPGVLEDRHFLKELRTLRAVIEKIKDGVLSPDKLIDFYNFRFRTIHTLSDKYGPFSNQTKEALRLLGNALQELSKAFVKAYDGSVLVTVVTTEVPHSRRSARAVTMKPLGHSIKWPYNYIRLEPEHSQEKISKVAQTGGRQESDVESVNVEERNYSPGYTESTPKSRDKSSTESPGFAAEDATGPETDPTSLNDKLETKTDDLPKDSAAMFNLFLHIGCAWFFSMLAIIYFFMEMDPGRDTIIYRMTASKSTKKDV